MIVRILAALWLAATIWTLASGLRLVMTSSAAGLHERLAAYLDTARSGGKWQLRSALLLAGAAMQSFLAGNLNTALWPWSTIAWVALFLQLLFLRPHLGGYVDIVRRGFERPVAPFTLVHIALDLAIAIPLVALVVSGVQ